MPIDYPDTYERFIRLKQAPADVVSKLRGEFFNLAMSVAGSTENTHEGAKALDALEEALSWAERGLARVER